MKPTHPLRPLRRLAPLLLGFALAAAGCAGTADASSAAGTSVRPATGTVSDDRGDDGRPAPGPVNRDDPADGPASATVGTWYRFDLYTHCGVSTLKFSGRYWRLIQMRTDIESDVAGPRVDWGQDYTPGYVQLESDRVAVFETAGQPPLVFEPTTSPVMLCK
ncbi:hypothetical protein [Streptomyces sp. NPDC093225]|uniref:hypothetical protein n=1 Tax=Streptomyces sp. NPDC093225 TaxID=3366034 RepID=UPI00381F16B7